jgi:hypothetical protein
VQRRRGDNQQIAAALLNGNNSLFYWSLFRISDLDGNAHGNNTKLTMRGHCQAEMWALISPMSSTAARSDDTLGFLPTVAENDGRQSN